MKLALPLALLLLAGCTITEAGYERADGTKATLYSVRLWTDTSASLATPDGLNAQYSSDADGAAAAGMSSRLLDALIGRLPTTLPLQLEALEP